MTIVVAAAAPDGLVLAADGRTTLRQGTRHRIASDHTRKVFTPFPGIGVATYGTALVGGQTIAGHMEEFAALSPSAPLTVASVSADLARHFTGVRRDADGAAARVGTLGFLVAGYDGAGVGLLADVLLVAGADATIRPRSDPSTRQPGHLFRGRVTHLRRLVEGYDADGLDSAGIDLGEALQQTLTGLGYKMNAPLSLQEAVDLATFMVRLTIDMERLTDGTYAEPMEAPVCGGAIQVLLVTSRGSRWIVEPRLRPSSAGLAENG